MRETSGRRHPILFSYTGTSFIFYLYDLHIMEGGGQPGCVAPASASHSVWIAFARRFESKADYAAPHSSRGGQANPDHIIRSWRELGIRLQRCFIPCNMMI